jgi:hypothetical protein
LILPVASSRQGWEVDFGTTGGLSGEQKNIVAGFANLLDGLSKKIVAARSVAVRASTHAGASSKQPSS